MPKVAQLVLRYLLIVAALAAAIYSGILARAAYLFQLDTANSVAAAVRLVPYNAAYAARLASWEAEERQTILNRAIALNPFDYESLIQLGLLAEMQSGDAAKAEHYYLHAAEVDRMFLPRWTLTNFYFRRRNPRSFFRWARETLELTPYTADPVFAQMWLMSHDFARLDAVIPSRPQVLLQYVSFLANNGRFEGVAGGIARLIAAVGTADPRAWGRDDIVASIIDRMLVQGDTENALKLWRVLKDGNWIQQSVPDPQHPLTNGDFRLPLFRHGFDWVPIRNEGVRIDRNSRSGLRITLNGNQPEHCVLLQQYLPLQSDTNYLLKWQAKSERPEGASGLQWHLRDESSGDVLGTADSWRIHAATGREPFLLSLEYSRPLGQIRSAEALTLDWVKMVKQ